MKRQLDSTVLHPVTWWLIGLLGVATAVISRSAWTLGLIAAASVALVILLEKPWFNALRLYLLLAIFVFLTRLIFRVIFNFESGSSGDPGLMIELPLIEINLGFGQPVHLLGPLSWQVFEAAFLDGLRLASIILAIGMANSLANPRLLLRSTPGALYEIASAISMAINLAPQLIESIQRVRQARALRGRSAKLSSMKSLLIPVLEDTIESSMKLAASMSARGFGRTALMSPLEHFWVKANSFTSLALTITGVFLVLSLGLFDLFALSTLVVGFLLSVLSLRISARKQIRTTLNRRRLEAKDFLALFSAGVLFISVTQGWVA